MKARELEITHCKVLDQRFASYKRGLCDFRLEVVYKLEGCHFEFTCALDELVCRHLDEIKQETAEDVLRDIVELVKVSRHENGGLISRIDVLRDSLERAKKVLGE